MLQPIKTKYRKVFRGVILGKETRVINLSIGNFGIKILKSFHISSKQLIMLRKIILKKMKNKGKLWIHAFPYQPITSKPASTRMGKGKGILKTWVFPLNSGRVLFEFYGVSSLQIKNIIKLCSQQLPVPIKLIRF